MENVLGSIAEPRTPAVLRTCASCTIKAWSTHLISQQDCNLRVFGMSYAAKDTHALAEIPNFDAPPVLKILPVAAAGGLSSGLAAYTIRCRHIVVFAEP